MLTLSCGTSRPARVAVITVALSLLAAGCSGSSGGSAATTSAAGATSAAPATSAPATSAPATSAAAGDVPITQDNPPWCVKDGDSWQPVAVTTAAGAKLEAARMGSGSRGIVLSHTADGDICQLWDNGKRLAAQGYQVGLFSFQGVGMSDAAPSGDASLADNVLAMAAMLRANGATKVVALGTSIGGEYSLEAAGHPGSGIDGVIAVSSPKADPALLRAIKVPVLAIVGDQDSGGEFLADAKANKTSLPSSELIVVKGDDRHGPGLIGTDGPPNVLAAVLPDGQPRRLTPGGQPRRLTANLRG